MTSAVAHDAPLDFFISYTPADEGWATWIAHTLEQAGYRTMLQAWDFTLGTNFIHLMDRGIREAAMVVAVLSPRYLRSRYGRMEWSEPFRVAPEQPESRLITVRIEECDLDGLLAQITYLDLVGVTDPEQAKELLLRRVRDALAGRARPALSPAYPGAQTPAAPPKVPRERELPTSAPVYPATAALQQRTQLSILHLTAPTVGGARTRDERMDASSVLLQVAQMVDDGAPSPDLVVLTGDLTASAGKKQFDEAHQFLTKLRARLGLAPDRVVLVPGPLDVNHAASRSYFEHCESVDEPVKPPYWQKWNNYRQLFRDFYDGIDGIQFEQGQAWTLFALPDLRVAVAGLNSTMAISHRQDHRYHEIGRDQALWFGRRLRDYQEQGWLRVGAIRHGPGSGPVALRDTATFNRVVATRLNLLLQGPNGGSPAPDGLTVFTTSAPSGCELLVVDAAGVTRWNDQAAAEPVVVPIGWPDVTATFAPPEQIAESVADDIRDNLDPARLLLDRIEEVCKVRFEKVQIRRVEAKRPYLIVTHYDDTIVRELWVAAHPSTPTADDLEEFLQNARNVDAGVNYELVYQGDQLDSALREHYRSAGLRLRSLAEFQGLLDLRGYVAAQTARLAKDRQYPPAGYVAQRYSVVGQSDQSGGDDLVAELLRQVGADHGRFILLLADFGRGKTFALRELARRIPETYLHLTPIFIELRNLDKAQSIDALVASHLADNQERNIDLDAFQYMLKHGRIVLLFDGFDELVTRTSYDRATDHLDTLLQAATDNAKIIVTSRSQHFQSHDQVLTRLGQRLSLVQHRRVLNIEEFSEYQIRSYLVHRYGDEQQADERLRLISNVENLLSLSHNPRMLGFIADLAPQRLRAVAQAGTALSPARLYQEILTSWLAFEVDRTRVRGAPSGLDIDSRWNAVTRLALRLWETNESLLRLPDIAEVAGVIVQIADTSMSQEQTTYAIGSGSLLVRTDEGLFGFIHGSVMEWLIAKEIAARLARGDTGLLSRQPLSQLTVDFLCDLADVRACERWVEEVQTDRNAPAAGRQNAIKVSSRLRTPAQTSLRYADLSNEDLSHRDFSGVDLRGANLTDARLVGTNLARTSLFGAKLVGARLDGANLERADLGRADLTRAWLLGANIEDVAIRGSRWHRTAVVGAKGASDVATAPELRRAALAPGRPVHSQLAPPIIGVSYGFHINIGRLPQPLAYSGEGDMLAIGCDNGGVVICDAINGMVLRTLSGHTGRVYGVAGLAGGRLVTAAADGTLRAWDLYTGEMLWCVNGFRDWVWPVVVSGRGRYVAASDSDGEMRLVDGETGALRFSLTGARAPVWTAAFSPDETRLACGSSEETVRLWDTATGELTHQFSGHSRQVYRLVYSPDGTMLVDGDADGAVRVWDAASGRLRHTLAGHQRAVYTVDFHPGSELLVSADITGAINLWDPSSGTHKGSLEGHRDAVYQTAFSPDGTLMASSDSSGKTRLWTVDLAGGAVAVRQRVELTGHRAAVWPGVFRPDSQHLATSSNDQTVRLWDTAEGLCRQVISGHGRRISSLSFDSGKILAACGNDGQVRLWDTAAGKLVRVLAGTVDQLVSAEFNPVASTLAAASNDGGVYMFNTVTGIPDRELDVETVSVWAEAFSPDGTTLATANDDDTVRLWSHRTGAQGHNLQEHRGRVRSIAFAPRVAELATGCDDGKVRLWDTASGRCRATLEGHGDRVYAVQYRADGRQLVSAGWDGSVRLWGTGNQPDLEHVLTGHQGRVWSAAYHPGGDVIASGGDDAVVRLWRVDTGAEVAALHGHLGRILAVAFNRDGRLLASAGDDGTVRIWRVDDKTAPVLRMVLIGQSEGWAVIDAAGRYKIGGSAQGSFWHAIDGCRFEPGELDNYLAEVEQVGEDVPF